MIKKLVIEDKPLTLKINLSFINAYNYNKGLFVTRNNLSLQSFDLLLVVVNHYILTGNGMSIGYVLKNTHFSHGYYHKVYSMMETLNKNGFIEYIGNGWNNCKLFAPTTRAIEGINNLVSSITV